MNTFKMHFFLLSCFLLSAYSAAFAGVGFEMLDIPDPADRPIQALVWYPSTDAPSRQGLAAYEQLVASSGRIAGEGLPLVIISHGTDGNAVGHHDTAFALAEAGFVAVALTHPGDNYADRRFYATRWQLTERPRQISLVLDYMVQAWSHRGVIDRDRIGIFGFSMGGFTALAGIGGRPEVAGLLAQCLALPQKPACQEMGGPGEIARKFGDTPLGIGPDPRLKAAFLPDGLRDVCKPVELWAAELDELVPVNPDLIVVGDGLPAAPVSHVEAGAGHYSFLTPCTMAQQAAAHEICADGAAFDRPAFHRRLNAAVVAFFRQNL